MSDMVDNAGFGPIRPVSVRFVLAATFAQTGPPYDADKVARLRAAIGSGAYAIDLNAVADAMIRFGR